jgi:hypothetical protein
MTLNQKSNRMFFNRFNIVACTLLLLTGSALWAHPGHGASESDSAMHYLIEPSHGWWVILLGAIVAGSWLFLRSRSMKTIEANANKRRSQ